MNITRQEATFHRGRVHDQIIVIITRGLTIDNPMCRYYNYHYKHHQRCSFYNFHILSYCVKINSHVKLPYHVFASPEVRLNALVKCFTHLCFFPIVHNLCCTVTFLNTFRTVGASYLFLALVRKKILFKVHSHVTFAYAFFFDLRCTVLEKLTLNVNNIICYHRPHSWHLTQKRTLCVNKALDLVQIERIRKRIVKVSWRLLHC